MLGESLGDQGLRVFFFWGGGGGGGGVGGLGLRGLEFRVSARKEFGSWVGSLRYSPQRLDLAAEGVHFTLFGIL